MLLFDESLQVLAFEIVCFLDELTSITQTQANQLRLQSDQIGKSNRNLT